MSHPQPTPLPPANPHTSPPSSTPASPPSVLFYPQPPVHPTPHPLPQYHHPADNQHQIAPVAPSPPTPSSSAPDALAAILPAASSPPPSQPPPPPRRRFSLLSSLPSRKMPSTSPSQTVSSATSREQKPPSEHDVRQILSFLRQGGNTADRNTPVGAILRRLRNRLAHPQWQISLKALTVAHAVLRGGPPAFVDFFAANPKNAFDIKAVREFDRGANVHVPFIRTYGLYLKAWCAMRTNARFPPNRMADPDAVQRFACADVDDLLRSLPPVLDLLDTLPAFVITPRLQASPVARPPLLMLLHDHLVLHSAVSRAMSRLVDVFFTQDISYAVSQLSLYDRFLTSLAEARPVLSAMRAVDPRWQLPEGIFSPGLRDEMQRYIDEGCPHTAADGLPPWTAAAKAATEPTLAPATQRDVDAVVRVSKRGDPGDVKSPIGAVVQVVRERMMDKDLKVVLKAQTLLLVLLLGEGGESDAVVHYFASMRHGELFGGGACVRDERDAHAPVVAWLARYLPARVAMLEQLRTSPSRSGWGPRATAERLLLTLPGAMEAADVLQELPVELSTRASPVARRGYLAVVGDMCRVFKEVVREANELVGVFFELEGEVAVAGLSVYERFVGVRERAKEAGGMFERAKIVDGGWRRPEEVVGGSEILGDMRMFVEMNYRRAREVWRVGLGDAAVNGDGEVEMESDKDGGVKVDTGAGDEAIHSDGDVVVKSKASPVVERKDAGARGIVM